MASFPSIAPVYAAPKSQKGLITNDQLGDGYTKLQAFGLNALETTWELTFQLRTADASTVDSFLQAQGDSGDKFQWQPPDGNAEVDWVCASWSVQYISSNWVQIRARFERVYELVGDLVSESLVCDPQVFAEISQTWYNIEGPNPGGDPRLFTGGLSSSFVDPFTDIKYEFAGRTSFSNFSYPLTGSESFVMAINPDLSIKWRYKYSPNDGYIPTPQFGHRGGLFEIDNNHIGTVHAGADNNTGTYRLYWTKIAKEDGALVEMKCYEESGASNNVVIKDVQYSKTYGTTAVLMSRNSPNNALSLGIFDSNFVPFGNGVNNWLVGGAGNTNNNFQISFYGQKTIEQKTDGVLFYNINGAQGGAFYPIVTGGVFVNMDSAPVPYNRQSLLNGFNGLFSGDYRAEDTSVSNDGTKVVAYGRGGGAVAHSCANNSGCSKLWARSVNDLSGYDWMIRIGPQFDAVNTSDKRAAYGFCTYVDDAIVAGYSKTSAGLDNVVVLIVEAATGQTIDAFQLNPFIETSLHILTDPRRPRSFIIASDYLRSRGAYRMYMDLDNLPADGTYPDNTGTLNWVVSRTGIDRTTFFEETDPSFTVVTTNPDIAEASTQFWYSIPGTQRTVSPTRDDIASGASPPTVDFNVVAGDFAWEAAIYTP